MSLSEQEYSLRDKKFAKTKVALMRAFMEKLQTTRFADISIKEVCESVEVSEGTFYNYFPQKVDVVYYFRSLVGLKVSWEIKRKERELSSWELIGCAFELIASELSSPYLFYEIISIFAAEQRRDQSVAVTELEKEYAYPDCEGIKNVEILQLDDMFSDLIKKAQEQKEISPGVDPRQIVLSLMTILVGVPLVVEIDDFARVKEYYHEQLSFLNKAIGVK